ncbi:MAG: sulfatase-like hydrolase/transferase, partial [Planctomycetota bacterium]
EFGCYGNKKHRTANLDRLSQTGVKFETCWANPICSPSRAEIMTGRYGFRTGWYHNKLKVREPLIKNNLTIGQGMKKAGYATAIAGKWQLFGEMNEYGFNEHCMWEKNYKGFKGPVEGREAKRDLGGVPGRAARYWYPSITKNGKPVPTGPGDYGPDIFVDFILDFINRTKQSPFFVYYPMCLPHRSWDFEAKKMGYLPVPQVDEKGRPTGKKVSGSLKSNVEYVDYLISRIVNHLDQIGIRNNTVVMFTCDNGTTGYGKGHVELERGQKVPMIVNCPGTVKPLGSCDELIDFSDVLPTVLELAQDKLPAGYVIDGHSFAPLLLGGPFKGKDYIFSCCAIHRMLRDKRWLLDGNGRFYDCADSRNEADYVDVTDSSDSQVILARQRFENILSKLPGPGKALRDKWNRRLKREKERNRHRNDE